MYTWTNLVNHFIFDYEIELENFSDASKSQTPKYIHVQIARM